MADQCIVCLESLDAEPSLTPQFSAAVGDPPDPAGTAEAAATAASICATTVELSTLKTSTTTDGSKSRASKDANSKFLDGLKNDGQGSATRNDNDVALLPACGHVLHESCLREWTGKANSCPICRQSFNLVHVYDKIGGTLLSKYDVEDKKQVAEFDPQAWLDENPEEPDDTTSCPVCERCDREDVLLLCDGCDTAYHTYCIGLDSVPRGVWFCMECVDQLGPEVAATRPPSRPAFLPRTQASMRQSRQRARSDEWQGAWGQIAGRVWDALSIDLDYNDDDSLEEYRRSQQFHERERRERQRWQQRLNIASQSGARDVFASSIQNVFAHRINSATPLPPSEPTREERKAWGAFEKALESEETGPSSRKRKSRSVTASPVETRPESARKLKRPRTRRLPVQAGEASSSKSASAAPANRAEAAGSSSAQATTPAAGPAPSFLSSLLKEVEMSTPSDDENIRQLFGPIPGANGASSPAPSPSASAYSSPRASSSTPPPPRNGRPISPIMSLSSHIEPIYPPANYQGAQSSPENSDSEQPSQHRSGAIELRQPRPRRSHSVKLPRSQDVSPTRIPLSLGTKENISGMVRNALKPHWKSNRLSADQYATINRVVSRKLYEGVTDESSLVDEDAKQKWEKAAKEEVAKAVSDLKA